MFGAGSVAPRERRAEAIRAPGEDNGMSWADIISVAGVAVGVSSAIIGTFATSFSLSRAAKRSRGRIKVRAHVRKDGTYVAAHVRRLPLDREAETVLRAIPANYTYDLEQISSASLVPLTKTRDALQQLENMGLIEAHIQQDGSVRFTQSPSVSAGE